MARGNGNGSAIARNRIAELDESPRRRGRKIEAEGVEEVEQVEESELAAATDPRSPKRAGKSQVVVIPAIKTARFAVKIVGQSPLIVHAFAEKAREEMRAKQAQAARAKKGARVPWKDYLRSLHWMSEKPDIESLESLDQIDLSKHRFGFPAIGLKACMCSAAMLVEGMTQSYARRAFHVEGELIEIHGTPSMREDMVRIGGMNKTTDIRYRAEFRSWSMVVPIIHMPSVLSKEQIVNLLNLGGFAIGIGEHRAERKGSSGAFRVATE